MAHTIPTPGTAGTIPAYQVTLDSGEPNRTPLRAVYVGRTPSPWTVYSTGRPMAPLYALDVEGLGRFVVETQRAFVATFLPDAGDARPVDLSAGPYVEPSPLVTPARERATLSVPTTVLGRLSDACRLAERDAVRAEGVAGAVGAPGTPFALTDHDRAMGRMFGEDDQAIRERIMGAREAAAAGAEAARFAAQVADARYALTATVLRDAEQARSSSALVDALDADPCSTPEQRDAAAAAADTARAAHRLSSALCSALDGRDETGLRHSLPTVQPLIRRGFAAGYPASLLVVVERAALSE